MARPWPIPQPLARCLVAVVIVLGGGQAALALPEGMVVQGGQLELQQLDANNALLRQGTGRAAADFNSFNIDAGQRLQILQPDASSTLLGRVLNGQITEIHGRLDANGRVLLINPAGLLVGPGGVVNTAAFTATTLHVDHQRFLQGGTVELKNLPGSDPRASVINRGTINVSDGGFAALIAPNVLNDGLITARLGQIQLASGTAATLDISGDGLLSVALDPTVAGSITNNGSLRASHVRLGGGDAAVLAAATVQQNGLIEARSIGELLGGRITIEGQHISVGRGAVLDASGANGGGTILVGGSWQNSDPSVRQATTTTVKAGALLDASATDRGNGGTVVAWSDIHNPASVTSATGNLIARGGASGGDGGRIETSGRLLQTHDIQIDASAPLGRGGEWLIDPYNISIIASPPTTGAAFNNSGSANPYLYQPTTADSTILASAVTAQLDAGTSVTISTGAAGSAGSSAGDITVSAPISSSGNATLRLEAARDIAFNSSITLSNSNGSLVLQAGRSITQDPNSILNIAGTTTATATNEVDLSNVNAFDGLLNLQAGSGVLGSSAFRLGNVSTGYNLTMWAFYGGISTSGTVSLGGSTTINFSQGDVALNVTGGVHLGIAEARGNLALTTTGNVTQFGQVRISGNTTVNAGGANVTLTHTSNDFTGTFSASNVNNLSLFDSNNLALGAITTTGNVSLGGSSVSLGGNLTTNQGTIAINNGAGGNTALTLAHSSILDTTNASSNFATAPGANITISGTITGSPGSSNVLEIRGGNNGDVLISNTVGAISGGTAPSALLIRGNDVSVSSLDGVGAISIAAANGSDTGSITLTGTTYRAVSSLELSSGIRTNNDPVTNSILLNGGGATTLSTQGGAILEISGTINLNGLALTLDSTAAGAVAAGGTIYVNDAIEGPGSLNINAGTTGVASINHLSGAIGATTPLTAVTLTNAADAGFNRNISAGTLTLNATNAITLQGQLALTGGLITTANPYAIKLWSGSNTHSTVAGSTTFLNTGALELGDAGGDAFTFAAGVVATAPASIRMVGTIGSTSGAITLGDTNTTVNVIAATIGGTSTGAISLGPITLAEGGGLTVGTGIANTVQMSSVSGSTSNTYPETLTINTSSAATIDGAISNLGTLTVTKAAGTTFNGAITATTIDIGTIPVGGGSTPNTVRFAGNLNVGTLNTSSGNYGIEIVGSSNMVNTTTFNNTYYVAIGDSTADTSLFSNGLVIPSTVTTGAYLIGTIRSSGAAINLSRSYFTGNTIFDSTNNGASLAGLVTLINTNAAGHNLTITGNASLSGTLTNTDNFSISGTTDLGLPTNAITTSGTQSYGGAITLSGNTTLTGSSISLGSILNGSGSSLTLNGNAIFNGAISGLSSLAVSGTSAINAASIATTGNQSYTGLVTLGHAHTTLTGSTPTFTAGIAGAGKNLTLNFSGTTVLSGSLVTNIANLSIGDAGLTTLSGSLTTSVSQTYNSPVTLGANTTLTGSTITLGSTLNGGSHSLTVSGNTIFNDSLSGLSSLTVSGTSTSAINTASITTTGNQSYGGPITLGANTTLTGSSITLGSTVNGSGYSLGLTGNAVFTDNLSSLSSLAVSGTSTINAASITTTGNQSYAGLVTLGNANATLTGSTPTFTTGIAGAGKNLTLNFSGTTALNGPAFTSIANLTIGNAGQTTLSGTLTTSASQTYNNPITLGANTTLTGSTITLGNTVNGGGYSLILNGNSIFNGALSSLSSLTVNGTSAINAASITTAGQQSYDGAISLLSNTTLSSTTGSEFSFGSAINGARALTVSSSGRTTFLAAIGSSTPLAGLTINAGTTGTFIIETNANTTVNGNIAVTARDIFIQADLISTSGDISLVGDAGTSVSSSYQGVYISDRDVEVKTLATNLVAGATGAINIQGRGGVASGSNPNQTHGVVIRAGAVISAGGTGNVSVTGIGGVSTTPNNSTGVVVTNGIPTDGVSEIRTAGGNITVNGTSGGGSGANNNYGVIVNRFARIAAGGSGSVSVTGNATENAGTLSAGVVVDNSNTASQNAPTAAITSAGGDITITGSGTTTGAAVVLRNAGRVSSGGSGSVTVVADSLIIDSDSSAAAGSITAGSSGTATATIRPRTAGTLIDLGGDDVLSGSPLTLGLSPAEIARITAGTLVVGSSTTGGISASQAVQLAPAMNLSLLSGSGLGQSAPLGVTGATTIATGQGDAVLSNSSNAFSNAIAFTGRSLQLASSTPLTFASSILLGDLSVTTANGAITQSGPVQVGGRTSFTTGSGNITLLDPANLFSVVPLTISSSGLIQIVPCSATNSCITIPDTAQARQDILTSNPGLSQSNQVNSIQAQSDPYANPVVGSRSPAGSGTQAIGSGRQQLNLGQASLEFNADDSSCANAQGCGGGS